MLLTLDIGNSAVKGGVFDGSEWARVFTVDHPSDAPPDAAVWADALRPHLRDLKIDRVGLVSVVPAATSAIADAARALTDDAPVTLVGTDLPLPFELAYETPETLGADRLAAAVAGWVRYGRPAGRSVLVVDAGTALTVEVVRRDGTYLGGTIGAGPALTRRALRMGTAQLPDVPLTLPDDPVGRSTTTALQSGLLWGLVATAQGLTARLAATLPDAPVLVLTGGWGSLLRRHLDASHHAPYLVLEGARVLTPPSG